MKESAARLAAALADRYRIERELGAGGMATVYLAEDLKHQRKVAIKVLRPELAAALGPERFLREITLTAQLDHPHILPLLDSGAAPQEISSWLSTDQARSVEGQQGSVEAGFLYYVMPYVEGESLRDRLDREKQLPLTDALRIAGEVADALSYAHSRGVIHRDIKPENILLSGGHARVADFGIARAIDAAGGETLTQTGMAIGTPAYMSPEQAAGDKDLDGRSDIYALGCVVYEMLAGEPPFVAPTARALIAKHIGGTIQPLRVTRESIPPGVEVAVMRSLARVPADRFATASQFAEALTDRTMTPGNAPSTPGMSRWVKVVLAGSVAVALIAVIASFRRSKSAPALDASLVAVAPFDVFDPGLELWREGMVDLLSRNLDGAGPLRTVSPTVVIRRWDGRADPESARKLGRNTGAGLALFGSLLTAGPDSVRLHATLLDVSDETIVEEWELRDVPDRIDRLADSLTVNLLRGLGRSRPIGAVRLAGLGSTSLPALKAFLQGEQHYRRARWDSALGYYERAIELDSTFPLALRRASMVLGWTRGGYDSLANAFGLRAATHNHGLAPRDSLLFTADSLLASLLQAGPLAMNADTGWSARLERLFATLEYATRRYPDDPEAWYLLGDAHNHVGPFRGSSYGQQLAAFDRSIALDSAFAPSYIHPVGVSFRNGADAGRRYLRSYLALTPNDVNSDGLRLVGRLLDSAGAAGLDSNRLFEGVSDHGLLSALNALTQFPDSGETAVALARFIASQPRTAPPLDIPGLSRRFLSVALMSRGHLRAGYDMFEKLRPGYTSMLPYTEAALLGVVPAESAAAAFEELFSAPTPDLLTLAFPWWLMRRDTASLRAAGRHAESLARSRSDPVERRRAEYVAASSSAYLSLARGDSADAIAQFLSLPRAACPVCVLDRLTTAQLLVERHRDREAGELLRGEFPTSTLSAFPSQVLWVLLQGRVAERLGEEERAISSYSWVAGMWRNPDPELRPYLTEAKEGLARLTQERKP